MKIFFEGYDYPSSLLEKYFSGQGYLVPLSNNRAKLDAVGYFFHCDGTGDTSDSIFILPKVFLTEKSEPFEMKGHNPEEFVNFDLEQLPKDLAEEIKSSGLQELIFDLSLWIYKTIKVYECRVKDTTALVEEKIQNIVSNKGDNSETYLDIILKLKKFHKDHRSLFTYIKIINNSGHNKIHWAKTIAKEIPIIRNNRPAYVSFQTKKNVINVDEELIVLFYSVLNYIQQKYSFPEKLDVVYDFIRPDEIQAMIDSEKGTRYLKAIRRKYFTDELVALWNILYVFFERSENIANKRYNNEILLVRDFQNVFEDMVDYLISDEVYPTELKHQKDHKEVDHLYAEESLVYDENIYFIGDSKYYVPQDAKKLESNNDPSVAKQYTYAKNIIQRNINVIYDLDSKHDDKSMYFRYRDERTQGYNITPNFFITGVVQKTGGTGKEMYSFNDVELENATTKQIVYNRQFRNRLFDRDTLLLQRYNINFLYVLTTYALQHEDERNKFRLNARKLFRKDITETIFKNYDVYKIEIDSNNIESFVKKNYWDLQGKLFSFDDTLLLANEKKYKELTIEDNAGHLELKINGQVIGLQKLDSFK